LRILADQESALQFVMSHCGVNSSWGRLAQLMSSINSTHRFVMLCTLATALDASAVLSVNDPFACAASVHAVLDIVSQYVWDTLHALVELNTVAPSLLAANDTPATPELLAHAISTIGMARQQAMWAVEQAILAHRMWVYMDAAVSKLASSLRSGNSDEQARLEAKAHAAGVISNDAAGAAAEPAAVLELVVQMHTSLWNPVRHQLQLLQAQQQQQPQQQPQQQQQEEGEKVHAPDQGPHQQQQQQPG
jgi:hypothetical protein